VAWRKDETYIYIPLQESDPRGESLVVRIDGNEANVISALSRQAEAIDPNAIVFSATIADRVYIQITPFRAIAIIAGALGFLALLLASIVCTA